MNKTKVIKELKKKYPNKSIVALPVDNPTEILCEINPSSDHPEYSIAVSVIDKSVPHCHKKTTETYKVIKGKLNLIVNGISHSLLRGDSFVIEPHSFHYAIGDETWVECSSKPGWEARDHILVKDVVPKGSRLRRARRPRLPS
ncbi:MAG: hypothetical protein Q8N84_02375 [bacterium]|nr:hypothetical protein [bacterium]